VKYIRIRCKQIILYIKCKYWPLQRRSSQTKREFKLPDDGQKAKTCSIPTQKGVLTETNKITIPKNSFIIQKIKASLSHTCFKKYKEKVVYYRPVSLRCTNHYFCFAAHVNYVTQSERRRYVHCCIQSTESKLCSSFF
jgi:hypothetical protein